MKLPPIYYHYFRKPLPYGRALDLQEQIHRIQLEQRKKGEVFRDVLLLLQHQPVFTGGRRQGEHEMKSERERLSKLGADFALTARGGQLTYHGPGQLVGYPLLDLSRWKPTPLGIRDYICRLQKSIEHFLLSSHGISTVRSDHTGVFVDPATKLGSIGVQVRHRLTTHGFALNMTREPLSWFGTIVACGLNDVKAGSIESQLGGEAGDVVVDVESQIPAVAESFGMEFEREMVSLNLHSEGSIESAVREVEEDVRT